MIISKSAFSLKNLQTRVDWRLLMFLILFLDVKLAVKFLAIVLIYLLQFNFRLGFKLKNSRLPLFYPLIIIIAVFDFLVNKGYTHINYAVVLLTGIGFWLLCILAIHQVKLSVDKNDHEVIQRTILLFFIINTLFSIFNMGEIIWETHTINPYTYQGQYQKYFIGTGDYIRGLTFDTSTTNAVLNAFGVIYFLTKKNTVMVLLCMAILLLTGSNFINIVVLLVLALLFFFNSNRNQKSVILICFGFLVVFMAKISPQNNNYVNETIANLLRPGRHAHQLLPVKIIPVTDRPDSILTENEKKQKIAMLFIKRREAQNKPAQKAIVNTGILVTNSGKIFVPKPDINSAPFQSLKTTPPEQKNLLQFAVEHKTALPISGKAFHEPALPGKVLSALQTVSFFDGHRGKILTGDGMGNFSSKLAFRASGLGFSGGFPAKYIYINHDFLVNHLDLYLNFFSKGPGFHSLTNSPFSVYDQLFAEYGLLGLLIFFVFYLGFFIKNYRALTYGLPILMLMSAVFFIDYWFEQLSVIVFFELLILLNIKESSVKQNLEYGN